MKVARGVIRHSSVIELDVLHQLDLTHAQKCAWRDLVLTMEQFRLTAMHQSKPM
jgi:hypothetical protein